MTPISRAGICNNREGGFTLVELMVVIVILGVLTMAMMPVMVTFGEDQLRGTARRLAGTARELFNESALNRMEYQLVFLPKKSQYGVYRMEPSGSVFERTQVGDWNDLPEGISIGRIRVGGNDRILDGEVISRIYPVGWFEETEILLKAGERRMECRINPLNGVTDCEEPDAGG